MSSTDRTFIPFIEVRYRGKLYETRYLSENQQRYRIGTHYACDLTFLQQEDETPTISIITARRQDVQVRIPADATLQMKAGDRILNQDDLSRLNLIKGKADHRVLDVPHDQETTISFSWHSIEIHIEFRDPPPKDPITTLPVSDYLRGTIRDLDWKYGSVLVTCIILFLFAGEFLYSLPTPYQSPLAMKKRNRPFTKVVIMPEQDLLPIGAFDQGVSTTAPSRQNVDSQQMFTSRLNAILGGPSSDITVNQVSKRGIANSPPSKKTKQIGRQQLRLNSRRTYAIKGSALQKSRIAAASSKLTRGSRRRSSHQQADLQALLAKNRYRFQQCYEDLLKVDKTRSGKIYLNFTINKNGQARNMSISGAASLQHPGFTRCLKSAIAAIQFEIQPNRSAEGVRVRYPLHFSPRT